MQCLTQIIGQQVWLGWVVGQADGDGFGGMMLTCWLASYLPHSIGACLSHERLYFYNLEDLPSDPDFQFLLEHVARSAPPCLLWPQSAQNKDGPLDGVCLGLVSRSTIDCGAYNQPHVWGEPACPHDLVISQGPPPRCHHPEGEALNI